MTQPADTGHDRTTTVEQPGMPELTDRKWTYPWQRPFLEALARMPNVSAACRYAQIARSVVYERLDDDEVFRAAVAEAKEIGVDFLERVAHRRATVGEERRTVRVERKRNATGEVVESREVETTETYVSDALLSLLLRAHRPEVFSDQVRHKGYDGGPVRVEVYRLPDEERLRGLYALALEEAGIVDAVVVSEEDGGGGAS